MSLRLLNNKLLLTLRTELVPFKPHHRPAVDDYTYTGIILKIAVHHIHRVDRVVQVEADQISGEVALQHIIDPSLRPR